MKKVMFSAIIALSLVAVGEYAFIGVRGTARGVSGEIVAFDVQSTNASQTATLKRVREIVAYTNAIDISSWVATNAVYFPEIVITNGVTNIVQGVSNIVKAVTVTNGMKCVVGARQCVTNVVADVVCTNGFTTAGGLDAFVVADDSIFVDCSDGAAKATVIIKK